MSDLGQITMGTRQTMFRHRIAARVTRRRRGVASVLAMLFLVLFAVMAVGFYASVTTSVQVASNEQSVRQAMWALDSGIGYVRGQLGQMQFTTASPTDIPGLFNVLKDRLETVDYPKGTLNMGGHDPNDALDTDGNRLICIPGANLSGTAVGSFNWIDLGPNMGKTRATIKLYRDPKTGAYSILVKVVGQSPGTAGIARAVQYTVKSSQAQWVSSGKGIITRSALSFSNGAQIDGDVTSVTASGNVPLTMSGGSKINGNFYYTANTKAPSLTNGAKIHGSIYPNAAAPVFPVVDTSIFAQFVPSASAPPGPKVINSSSVINSNATLTNIRIKANSNISFGNSVNLNGVIYIESPNRISFGGGSRITGVIVTDNNSSVPLNSGATNNVITLDNGVRIDGVENLDASQFAASENIPSLKNLAGAIILAPNYKLVFAGGARSYSGSMVASNFDISNGYKGTVSGNVINLNDTSFTMMGGGQLSFADGSTTPAGLFSGVTLSLDTTSYLEVPP